MHTDYAIAETSTIIEHGEHTSHTSLLCAPTSLLDGVFAALQATLFEGSVHLGCYLRPSTLLARLPPAFTSRMHALAQQKHLQLAWCTSCMQG